MPNDGLVPYRIEDWEMGFDSILQTLPNVYDVFLRLHPIWNVLV